MSLKDALLKHKQQLDEMKEEQQTMKIQQMLEAQQELLEKYSEERKASKKVDYSFNPDVIKNGGITYWHTEIDGKKRKFKISITNKENDVILKYHVRLADGSRFSVNAHSYKDAQLVVDEIFSVGMYHVSGTAM